MKNQCYFNVPENGRLLGQGRKKSVTKKNLKLHIPKFKEMKVPTLGLKQKIYYERLLVESKVKECDHPEKFEDWCMICKAKIR